jgi:primosomal protein N' (replication factor Y)
VRLGLWVANEYCSTAARGLELALPPGTAAAAGPVAPRRELHAAATDAGRDALAGEGRLGTRQRAALELLASESGTLSAEEVKRRAGADRQTLRRLEGRGLVRLSEVEVSRRPDEVAVGAAAERVSLNPAQLRAVGRITGALDSGEGAELLLWGVTGSGKTEVYLAAAEAALERGFGAIVLVPEIALTPQALARFRRRLGDRVALLHSALRPGERRDEWERLRRGEARVCLGPRSAVFAPVPGLGLIVIDEEHEPSYKQESDPRYDAREVARRRGAEAGAVIVAGSATPRPESWLALERLELLDRVDGRALPPVDVLDMREHHGEAGPLHPLTASALARAVAGGGKAIVLLNRRGWAPFLSCRECGRGWRCPECDVSLVVHRDAGRLRCHHCGHAEPLPRACPDCGSVTLARQGTGTERAEAELAKLAAPAPVFRLDSDSAGRRQHGELLARFEAAPAGVLVGTQMVARGHDFPDVVLSVVLDADAALRFPDFRAEERTFALVSQLAGRSGRGSRGGRVLVQTLAPAAPAIAHAARHDARGFVAGELERREALGYPPFSHLARVEVASTDPAAAEAAAERLRGRIGDLLPGEATLLGPAPRFRRRGRHRRQLLVKAPERGPAVRAIREAVHAASAARELRGASLSVDVDPQ